MTGMVIHAPPRFWRPHDDRDDRPTPGQARLFERLAWRQRLREVCGGAVWEATTVLPMGAGFLPPARDRTGRVLQWTLWIPGRRALVDVFRRALPPPEEQEDRAAYAAAQGLRYGVVEPGYTLTFEALEEWFHAD